MKSRELAGIFMILFVIVLLLLGSAYVNDGRPLTDHGLPLGTATIEPVMQMIGTASAQETQVAQQVPHP